MYVSTQLLVRIRLTNKYDNVIISFVKGCTEKKNSFVVSETEGQIMQRVGNPCRGESRVAITTRLPNQYTIEYFHFERRISS